STAGRFKNYAPERNSLMKTFIAPAVLLALLLQVGAGQTARRSSAKPKRQVIEKRQPKQPADIYSAEPFNTALQMLPVGYKGHDAKRIYDIFQQRLTPKEEFETTEAHRNRIANAAVLPLIGSLTISQLFVFELDTSIFEYDADKESLLVGAVFGKVDDGTVLTDSYHGLILDAGGDFKQEAYEGSNAYGAKIAVEKTTILRYELAIGNWDTWQTEDYIEPYLRKVEARLIAKTLISKGILNHLSLAPTPAETLKPNFRLLAICRLKYPFIGKGGIYIKPTFDNPRESYYIAKYLYADLLELWAYDQANGQVLYKRQK